MSIGVSISKRAARAISAAVFVALCGSVAAQEPSARKASISFLPAPLEGTISLGIYDAKGTLVRVLHREADVEDFLIGADALKTTWDGKNDAGQEMPPGKYHARGYAVDVDAEGVGFFFNDWITDEQSPRVRRISRIWFHEGKLILDAEVAGGQRARLLCDENGRIVGVHSDSLPTDAVTEAAGKDDSVWRLETMESPPRVKQFSRGNELIREMKIAPDDPQPIAIAASKTEDRIFILEENAATQRVRCLTLLARKKEGDQAVSDWKTEFEKKIVAHKEFAIENGKPVVSGGKPPVDRVTVKLQANALAKGERSAAELLVGYDPSGSFIKSADGLPLLSISETAHLTRVVLSPRGETEIDVFQDDDAVVEQFRVTKLDQMMAFDAGEFELK